MLEEQLLCEERIFSQLVRVEIKRTWIRIRPGFTAIVEVEIYDRGYSEGDCNAEAGTTSDYHYKFAPEGEAGKEINSA
ncbi:unnamed protein product [Cylicostephanus goldi]|uniref:Uncharacterized protein n=1 Tax=Cylicostephanus goldi TaxID=71465 RepID=A0A3P6S588_CYLGO|nr:unnamed protein product [Cylicostephanus goldi]